MPNKKKIKMIKTERGCSDGITVKTYEAGKTYFVSIDLANVFIKEMKVAKPVIALKQKENRIDNEKINTLEK